MSAGANLLEGTEAPSLPERIIKPSRRAEKVQKWESLKPAIHCLYVLESKTLETTMSEIERQHNFKASVRKWKMKIKEWKFDKNLGKDDMAILVSKAEKRAREEEKDTTFYHGGIEIKAEKFENFKRRRTTNDVETVSSNANTPANVIYSTPRSDSQVVSEITTGQSGSKSVHNSGDDFPEMGDLSIASDEPTRAVVSVRIPPLISDIELYPMLRDCNEDWIRNLYKEPLDELGAVGVAQCWAISRLEEIIQSAHSMNLSGRKEYAVILYLAAVIVGVKYVCWPKTIILEFVSELLALTRTVIGWNPLSGVPYSSVPPTYRQLSRLLEETFGHSADVTIHSYEVQADLQRLNDRAALDTEVLYHKAIAGYDKIGKVDERMRCQLSLTELLLALCRTDEAGHLLATSLTYFVKNNIAHWIHGSTRYYSAFYPKPTNLESSLSAIQSVFARKLKASTMELWKDIYPYMLFYSAVLGTILSQQKSDAMAAVVDCLFSTTVGKLETLQAYNELKVLIYLERSYHHLNRRAWRMCLNDTLVACRYLVEWKDRRFIEPRCCLRIQIKDDLAVLRTQMLEPLRTGDAETSPTTFNLNTTLVDPGIKETITEIEANLTRIYMRNHSPHKPIQAFNVTVHDSGHLSTSVGKSWLRNRYGSSHAGSSGMSGISSTRHGVTYTDGSVMSGISFNYEALFY